MSAHDGGACAGTGAVRRAAAAPAPRRPTSARGATQLAYVLMHDKKGWTSLAAAGADAYLRVHGSDLPDVDVEKGTLVEVDPEGDFDPRTNISVNVVSLDRPEIKISLLMKVGHFAHFGDVPPLIFSPPPLLFFPFVLSRSCCPSRRASTRGCCR